MRTDYQVNNECEYEQMETQYKILNAVLKEKFNLNEIHCLTEAFVNLDPPVSPEICVEMLYWLFHNDDWLKKVYDAYAGAEIFKK